MYCVFDGGLSIQEYEFDVGPVPSPGDLQLSALTTEFIRGEGMGGGVGGMVYSIKPQTANPQLQTIICSHANHRGDVIARSDETGSLTSFALYEAYGTRPYEWGEDPDRQKANTKEEEKDLGLLNEGMRYRDLDTGTFLTRDPIGYDDGPNVYCYVHCNPIMQFDAWGMDVYRVNRELAKGGKGEEPKVSSSLLSHTYIAVTDDDGKVIETYSWGNEEPDENGERKWAPPSRPNDVKAAQTAVDRERKREKQKQTKKNSRGLGPKWAKKVGDESKNQDAKKAYEELSESASSKHKHGGAANNCKTEADNLERRMNELHKERTEGQNQTDSMKADSSSDSAGGGSGENTESKEEQSASGTQTQTQNDEEE